MTLDVTLTRLELIGSQIFIEWSVPEDSASWLAPIGIDRKVGAAGLWTRITDTWPWQGTIAYAPVDEWPGIPVSFRLAWGPTGVEHTSPPATITTPVMPDAIAWGGNTAAAIVEWRVPAGNPFAATGYWLGSNPPTALGRVNADAEALHLEDPDVLLHGSPGDYALGWDEGDEVRYTPTVHLAIADERVDLLSVLEADSNRVVLAWVPPDIDPYRTMVIERANGTSWDSLRVPALSRTARAR